MQEKERNAGIPNCTWNSQATGKWKVTQIEERRDQRNPARGGETVREHTIVGSKTTRCAKTQHRSGHEAVRANSLGVSTHPTGIRAGLIGTHTLWRSKVAQ